MVIIIVCLGIFIFFEQKSSWETATNLQMKEQVKDIIGLIDSRVKGDMAEVAATANLAKELYLQDNFFSIDGSILDKVKVTNQIDQTTKEVKLPQMYFKGLKTL